MEHKYNVHEALENIPKNNNTNSLIILTIFAFLRSFQLNNYFFAQLKTDYVEE